MLQIVKASVPGAALAEAGLRDERFFAHRVDEAVPAKRPLGGKAELKAALCRVQNVLPHGAVDKLRRGEDEYAAAAPQAGLLRRPVGAHRVARAEREALSGSETACLRGELRAGRSQMPRTDDGDTRALQKPQIAPAKQRRRTSCAQLLAKPLRESCIESCNNRYVCLFRREQVSVQLPLAAKERDNVPRLVLGVPEPAHVLDGYIAERIFFSDPGRTRASR